MREVGKDWYGSACTSFDCDGTVADLKLCCSGGVVGGCGGGVVVVCSGDV